MKPDDVTIMHFYLIILIKYKYNINANKIYFLFYYIT